MTETVYGIFDTGYSDSTQSTGNTFTQANSGSEVKLYVMNQVFNSTSNKDIDATPNKVDTDGYYDISEVNPVSINNDKITLKCVFKRSDSTHIGYIQDIHNMLKTKGVKVFYYMSTTDSYNTIPNILGTTDDIHPTTGSYTTDTTPHFHVYVDSVTVTEDNGNMNGLIKVNVSLVRTR